MRRNLNLIKDVAREADVEVILAFKAYALWKTFPIFREYIRATTASSLSEARLAFEEFGSKAHTFSPAYTDYEIDEIARLSSHLQFNSLTQYTRYHERVRKENATISLGLRINPEYSEVEPTFIILVLQALGLVLRPISCPKRCLLTLKVFIVIVIVRVGRRPLNAPFSI